MDVLLPKSLNFEAASLTFQLCDDPCLPTLLLPLAGAGSPAGAVSHGGRTWSITGSGPKSLCKEEELCMRWYKIYTSTTVFI